MKRAFPYNLSSRMGSLTFCCYNMSHIKFSLANIPQQEHSSSCNKVVKLAVWLSQVIPLGVSGLRIKD